jgi:hypothetical protein
MQRDVAALIGSADADGELLVALAAVISALGYGALGGQI